MLKCPTLQRNLYQADFGSTHLETYKDARESSSKMFLLTEPNDADSGEHIIRSGTLGLEKRGKRTDLSALRDR